MYLEKAMAPHSSTPAWKIPWMEEPGRLHSMGLLKVRHDWGTSLSLFTCMHWRRKWQPTRVLAWKIPGTAEPGGLLYMGSHRVGHNWSDLAAAMDVSPMVVLEFFFLPSWLHYWHLSNKVKQCNIVYSEKWKFWDLSLSSFPLSSPYNHC